MRPLLRLAVCLTLAALAGCADEPPPEHAVDEHDAAPPRAPRPTSELLAPTREERPRTARVQMDADLRTARRAPRHVADGAGVAELLSGPDPITAGAPGRWRFRFRVGPDGIAVGGRIDFQTSPFWGWSNPQHHVPEAFGYTRVTTDAEGVQLELASSLPTRDPVPLTIRVGGRPLVEGETLEIDYGAGLRGARADRYAEDVARFWFVVDGDGDGFATTAPDPPAVRVVAGPAHQLVASAPSSVAPGESVTLVVAAVDAVGNADCAVDAEVEVRDDDGGFVARAPLDARGLARIDVGPVGRGVHRWDVTATDLVGVTTNPCVASDAERPILWGDLHGHSLLSDGTATVEQYYRYARDVAGLDVAALTDHDHWGFEPLDDNPSVWDHIRDVTASFHEPGRFVTLPAFEWTSWLHGHRHVLYFGEGRGDDLPFLSSLDDATRTPGALWDALEGLPVTTVAHHSAGGPVPTNWTWPPDPVLEPVTEVMGVHGCSEALDAPRVIYSPLRGNFVRDVLDAGHRLGFVGSGDSHDGHPGLAHLASPAGNGGLVAFVDAASDRGALLDCLRSRRTYATSGRRILVRAALGGRPMGAEVPPGDHELQLLVYGTAPIESLDVIRSGEVVARLDVDERRDVGVDLPLDGLGSGEYVYLRVVQRDRHAAWTSPFFIR